MSASSSSHITPSSTTRMAALANSRRYCWNVCWSGSTGVVCSWVEPGVAGVVSCFWRCTGIVFSFSVVGEPRTSKGRSMPVVLAHSSLVSQLIISTQHSGWHPILNTTEKKLEAIVQKRSSKKKKYSRGDLTSFSYFLTKRPISSFSSIVLMRSGSCIAVERSSKISMKN